MYVKVRIYNVEERQIIVVYFKFDMKNARKRLNNFAMFNIQFNNVWQPQNNVNMTTCKK